MLCCLFEPLCSERTCTQLLKLILEALVVDYVCCLQFLRLEESAIPSDFTKYTGVRVYMWNLWVVYLF